MAVYNRHRLSQSRFTGHKGSLSEQSKYINSLHDIFVNYNPHAFGLSMQIYKFKRYSLYDYNIRESLHVKAMRKHFGLSFWKYIEIIPSMEYSMNYMRRAIYMKNYKEMATDNLKGLLDSGKSIILQYSKDVIKHHFGKEFTIYGCNEYILDKVVTKFIKKYDKNFKKHSQKISETTYKINNSQFLVTLTQDTFMYVATGIKISSPEKMIYMGKTVNDNDMYIYIFGKKMRRYSKELENILVNENESKIIVYNIDRDGDTKNESMSVLYSEINQRDLSTLFYSHDEKEIICQHIDKFNSNAEFYKERQILYKTGILLYGKPGTGKSSLIKAIATKYHRNIVNINISNIKNIDLNELTQSINFDDNEKYIVLLEDIDTLFLNRKKGIDKEDASVINKLLQFLDSNSSPTNVIFIATTNHIDRLDEALLRDGRFDLKVEILELDKSTAIEYCKSFGLSEVVAKSIVDEIHSEKSTDQYNQSTLQTRCLAKIENKSIEEAKNIHEECEKD